MIFFCLDMREETQRLKKEREAIEREKAELMALTRGEGNRGNLNTIRLKIKLNLYKMLNVAWSRF